MKTRTSLATAMGVLSSAMLRAQTPTVQENWWVTNGTVNTIEVDALNDRVYIGGNFTTIGPNAAFGAKLSYPASTPDLGYDKPNGRVRAVSPDGNNGWYIGGDFTQVGGVPRNKIAHLLSSGEVDPNWDPGAGASITTIRAIAVDGPVVYVGGEFSSIGNAARTDLARIDAGGIAEALFPDNGAGIGSVQCLLHDGAFLFVGGDFDAIDGKTYLAKVNTGTNAVEPWDPAPDAAVRTIQLANNTVYAGGDFIAAGTDPVVRRHAAAFDAFTGTIAAWDPDVDGIVHTMVVHGGSIFLGGEFTNVNTSTASSTRRRLAQFDLTGGSLAVGWMPVAVDPNPTSMVRSLAISSNDLIVGGTFQTLGGAACVNLGSVVIGTGAVNSWTPTPGGTVDRVASSAADVFVGGDFACIGGERRLNLAALDAVTGASVPFATSTTNGPVFSLLKEGNTLYVGGRFTNIGGAVLTPRNRLAALDAVTGALLAFDPSISGGSPSTVYALCMHNNALYVGGLFTNAGGQPRNCAAALDPNIASNNALPWDPDILGSGSLAVRSIAVEGSKIFLGGSFTTVGGNGLSNFTAVDMSSGSTVPGWTLGANNTVSSIEVDGSTVYAAGSFTTIHGSARTLLARLDAATGIVDAQWAPSIASTSVDDISLTPSSVIIGGGFQTVNGAPHARLAAISKATGDAAEWDMNVNGALVNALDADGAMVFVGGTISELLGAPQRSIFAFQDCPALDQFADADGDLHGSPGDHRFSCSALAGYVTNSDDCDDTAPMVHIGAACDDGDPFTSAEMINGACVCSDGTIKVAVKALLQGPFSGGLMTDHYRAFGMLPMTEPYTGLGYVHAGGGGGETMSNALLLVSGNDAIVDWGVVELRSGSNPALVLYTHSVLFQRDGDILHADGGPSIRFNAPPGEYHVAIRHRNHLGVMTAAPVTLGIGALTIDFTSPSTPTAGTAARFDAAGTMLLWAGDVVANGQVKYTGAGNDRDPVLVRIGGSVPTATAVGYYNEDINMDGIVKYTGTGNDRDPILLIVGGTVPTAVVNGTLP